MASEAVQVIRSTDYDEKKRIQIVKENERHLQDLLLSDNVKDLPIYVFSIAGKTRGGKSFLLNLMIKYLERLEKKKNGDWLSGGVPNCFTWKNGIESITRGLWIYPKIFRLKNCLDEEVGVILMDMEGLYDGEATDGEIIAISGISAAISYLQMFNIKDKITGDYLESVVRTLIKGIEELKVEEKDALKEDYKLMFVVRDWIGEHDHAFGLNGGTEYIENERKRGTKEHQQLWELILKTFHEVECVLLPHPGLVVTKPKFNGDLGLLEDEFLDTVKHLVEHLFKPDNLFPPSTQLNGQDIYRILKSIDGRFADDELSFLNIFTEHANLTKVEKWKSSFQDLMADVKFSGLQDAKTEMFNIISKAQRTLTGKSRSDYLDDLTQALQSAFNKKVAGIFSQRYKSSLLDHGDIDKQHSCVWSEEKRMLHEYLCGNSLTRENAYVIFVKNSAAHYYNLLHKMHKRRFQAQCSKIKTLEECAGLDEQEIKSFKRCEDFSNGLHDTGVEYPLWLKECQGLRGEITDMLLQKIGNITKMEVGALKELRTKQYEHFESFTLLNKDKFNMDNIPKSSRLIIAKIIGYGMFGLPKYPQHVTQQRNLALPRSEPSLSTTFSLAATAASSILSSRLGGSKDMAEAQRVVNETTGYSKEQESKIWPFVDKVISLSPASTVKLSCTFLVYHKNSDIVNVPIFRVETRKGIIFLDSTCREYTNWDDFLSNNTLPDVVYCYPLIGWYNRAEGFYVAFSSAPSSKTTTKVLKAGDTIGKTVTGVAGVAGIAVLCGVAAPFVAGTAMIGGFAGGTYGAIRGVQKIRDKKDHCEPIKREDVLNVAANCLSVVGAATMAVGRAMAVTADVLLNTSRAAAGLSGLTSLSALFMDTNDTAALISLISEVEDSSLKMLFYFGTTNSKDTLNHIRKSLKLEENKNTVETLMALLENNCIKFASGDEDVRFEKYVSQSTAELVTSILTTISSDVRDVVMHFCDFVRLFQYFNGKMIRKEPFVEEVDKIMVDLIIKLEDELEVSETRLINTYLTHQNPERKSENSIFFRKVLDFMDTHESKIHLLLNFRFFLVTLISEIRKANNFFNSIEHEATTLKGHYLSDVRCHPLCEVSRLVKERVEQTESAVHLKATDMNELKDLVFEILNILEQSCKKDWSVHQFARCFSNITKDMVSSFKDIVNQHKDLISEKKKISCDDLDTLTEELGLEGYDYGTWVSKKVINELKVDVEAVENMAVGRQNTPYLSVMPAWGGVLDGLYHYYTNHQGIGKFDLIKHIEDINESNYSPEELNDRLSLFTPCDGDTGLGTFVVFSYKDRSKGGEEGFIWLNKEE